MAQRNVDERLRELRELVRLHTVVVQDTHAVIRSFLPATQQRQQISQLSHTTIQLNR
jgi:hypothetical protein